LGGPQRQSGQYGEVNIFYSTGIYTVWMDICRTWMKAASAGNALDVFCSIRCLVCERILHDAYIEDMFSKFEA
jgi:hypothetical protein